MDVVTAAAVEAGECNGGFGVRGFAFLEGQTLMVCARVVGDPPKCGGESLEALLVVDSELQPAQEVQVLLDFRGGRRTARAVRPVAPINGQCAAETIGVVMSGVEGAGWGLGYAYVPDDRDDVAESVRSACGGADVTIERGPTIKTVDGGSP